MLGYFLLHGVQIRHNLVFLVVGKGIKHVRADNFAVFHRRHDHPHRHMQQRNFLPFGFFLQNLDVIVALFLIFLADNAQLLFIKLVLHRLRQIMLHRIRKLFHIFGKTRRRPGRKIDRYRLMRLVKVIDVSPVVRRRALFALFFQNALDQAGLPGTLRPQAEQVVAAGFDVYPQFHRTDGAILPQRRQPFFQIRRRGKIKFRRVAFAIKLLGS